MNLLLIAGTDIDAGKTVLTSVLAAYWQMYFPDRSLGLMQYGSVKTVYSSEIPLNPP